MPPRITIWVTPHYISQRVAAALKLGLKDEAALAITGNNVPAFVAATDIHIGYGILRGMDEVYREAGKQGKTWFECDLGYTEPGHFDGNYRISYKGTQALFDPAVQQEGPLELTPWKTGEGVALICPPTDYVCAFFGIDGAAWIKDAEAKAAHLGLPVKIRHKGDKEDLDTALAGAACVITFNSSVGWRALQKGIPALSDVQHSTVGSWHGVEAGESLDVLRSKDRVTLFRFMYANQLDLLSIQNGMIKNILKRFVSF